VDTIALDCVMADFSCTLCARGTFTVDLFFQEFGHVTGSWR